MESLIDRARTILGMGLSEEEIAGILVESGETVENVYLAVKAASIIGPKEKV